MNPIVATLRQLGGTARLSTLVEAGHGSKAVQRLAARGVIERARRGWYFLDSVDRDIVRAVRIGGRLACISACREYGIWTPVDDRIHVSLWSNASHLKSPDDAHRLRTVGDSGAVHHWNQHGPDHESRGRLPTLPRALEEALSCQSAEIGFAMVDSAMHRGVLSDMDRWELYHRVPERCRASVEQADGVCESGTESLFSYRMRALGIIMQAQAEIDGVGRVDFLIGDRLIVEIDSEEHHGSPSKRRRDLLRDAIAAALGFITLRFDYWQIMEDWETVKAAVLESVSRGDHRGTSRGTR